MLEDIAIPKSLQQLIENQIERLGQAEREVLETASVIRVEFATAAVAAGGERAGATIETCCETLARKKLLLERSGRTEWPDGTFCTRYKFRHVLYQNILYNGLTDGQRTRLHRLIRGWLESSYGEQAGE